MASKFSQYKEETGTTPLPTFIDTELFNITKALASEQDITHATWVRRAITEAVNAQGVEYTYPVKEELKDQLAKALAEVAALKALIPTPPAQQANLKTGKVEDKA